MGDKYDSFLDSDSSSDAKRDAFLDSDMPLVGSRKGDEKLRTPLVESRDSDVPSSTPLIDASQYKPSWDFSPSSLIRRASQGTMLYPEEEAALRKIIAAAGSGPVAGAVQLGADASGADSVSKAISGMKNEGKDSIVGSLLQPEAWLMGGPLSKLVGTTKQALGMGASGAAYGALSPNDSMEARGDAALTTGGISAAIPVVGKMVNKLTPMARDLTNSIMAAFSKGARVSTGHKMVLAQLPEAERAEVLGILGISGIDTSQLGSQLTSAQALGYGRVGHSVKSPAGARIAALEEEVSKMRGGEQINRVRADQAGVRSDMLDSLSGGRGAPVDPLLGMSADDLAVQAARKARGDTARQLYPSGNVTGDPRLNEILNRPGVQSAMGIEEASAGNVPRVTQVGKDVPAKTVHSNVFTEWQQTPYKEELPAVFAQYPIKTLQNQYRLMDKEITRLMKTGVSVDESRAYELMAAKKDLGSWLSSASPEWAQANRIFASQSVPVRRMEIGAALKGKMETSPQSFLKATDNVPAQENLIRQTTGRAQQQLSDIFNLGQMSKISGLRNEAQIMEEVGKLESMARATLGDEKAFQLPNLLNVWVAIANRFFRANAKATVDEITQAAARTLANPNELRKVMIQDAARRTAARSPVSQKTLGKVMPPAFVSGGLLTGDNQ